jgi:hypothetical protein
MTLVHVGETLYLHEEDYLYGRGRLALRVTQVLDLTGPQWAYLRGIPIAWDGSGQRERDAWVSLAALRQPRTHQAP